MKTHQFVGKWISDEVLCAREPRNIFHRQLNKIKFPKDEHANSHVLFRKKFLLNHTPAEAKIYISADDYYKLYINGTFVGQGPAPAYHHCYNYNVIDVTSFLEKGENVIAVHTYYQGLINRVWQSGDFRHGLLLDLVADGDLLVASDESFLTHRHTAYTDMGEVGYHTQFLERYDSRAHEVDFFALNFDDSSWKTARYNQFDDHDMVEQTTKLLKFETIQPVSVTRKEDRMILDFGGIYVGYLSAKAKGVSGDVITLYAGQELNEDGSVRHAMRCNCDYTEEWILSGGEDVLNQFDFKSFRYAELVIPEGVTVEEICLVARHYPFTLACDLRREFVENDMAKKIWELCVRSQRVGVQETIQDCMDREKGFYLGDGCYSAFANYLLTGDDSMTRKLIDDAFASSFITEGLVTCMDCSFMQEIAEFPLILADLILWHYRASGDEDYLRENYGKIQRVLNNYRDSYEKDGLLCDLDRWCVVEWPQNFRDGYAVEIKEGQVCEEPHISINAYYYRAVCCLNRMAEALGETPYRDEKELQKAILDAFYDREKHIFYDGVNNRHVSLPGNVFAYAFELVKDEIFDQNFLRLLAEKGEDQTFLFTSFPLLCRWAREGNFESMKKLILHENTWSRMLREDATTTFEGWGKDCKWNTSLFHMTMSAVAMFMADVDLKKIF